MPCCRGTLAICAQRLPTAAVTEFSETKLLRIMAEIAAIRGLVLVMAFHAIYHRCGLFLRDNVPICHGTMTHSALDSGLLMMRLV